MKGSKRNEKRIKELEEKLTDLSNKVELNEELRKKLKDLANEMEKTDSKVDAIKRKYVQARF